jgi:hypothetical protein
MAQETPSLGCGTSVDALIDLVRKNGLIHTSDHLQDDNYENASVWPTWNVGALFKGARCIHIDRAYFHINTSQSKREAKRDPNENFAFLLLLLCFCLPRVCTLPSDTLSSC